MFGYLEEFGNILNGFWIAVDRFRVMGFEENTKMFMKNL
jgi:hypothetical protein